MAFLSGIRNRLQNVGVPGVQTDDTVPPEVGMELLNAPSGKPRVGKEEIHKAAEILTKYKQGKQNLESRIVEDELWWELRHWEVIRNKRQRPEERGPEPSSAWLFPAVCQRKRAGISGKGLV